MIRISGEKKHVSYLKNPRASDAESFLEAIFDLNWICKILFTWNRQIWTFNATDLLNILLKDSRNAFKIATMLKNECLKKTGPSYDQKFVFSDNPGQNIWNKIEKSSKPGQDNKSLISTFAWFLAATAKVEFGQGRLGVRLCLHPNWGFS